jgi:hypothetical protein
VSGELYAALRPAARAAGPARAGAVDVRLHTGRIPSPGLVVVSAINFDERYFALNGTDRSHAEQDAAISDDIRWRNQRAKPQSGLATDSKIGIRITRSRLHDVALVRQTNAYRR